MPMSLPDLSDLLDLSDLPDLSNLPGLPDFTELSTTAKKTSFKNKTWANQQRAWTISYSKNDILYITPKVVDTFLIRLLINGAWLQKVSTGK